MLFKMLQKLYKTSILNLMTSKLQSLLFWVSLLFNNAKYLSEFVST